MATAVIAITAVINTAVINATPRWDCGIEFITLSLYAHIIKIIQHL